jgi:hypothetical protein
MGRVQKRVLRPDRLRAPPREGFGWIDRRLLREGFLQDLALPETALYFGLLCAADKDGLSFYGDRTLARLLGLTPPVLARARRGLVEKALVAYEPPLYQVLALPSSAPPPVPASSKTPDHHPAVLPESLATLLARHAPALFTATRPTDAPGGHPRKTPESRAF